jgi:hypothetical protein
MVLRSTIIPIYYRNENRWLVRLSAAGHGKSLGGEVEEEATATPQDLWLERGEVTSSWPL